VLKTLVSRLSARSSGVFHATIAAARQKVVVPTETLLQRLQALESEKNLWVQHLGNRLPMIRISYEGFVADPESRSAQLLRFLDVAHAPLKSTLVKLNPERLEDVVENYLEVKAIVTGSAFESYLNEHE
jgi:LPS sulfotransferase NodH